MWGVDSAWMVIVPAPAFGEVGDLALGALDHEMDVEERAEVPQRLDRVRPHRDRRHEVAVHDVDVDDGGAGVEDGGDLLAQPAEVGGQDRWGDPARHTSTSIDPPQWLHVSVAVLVMRTIVPCSPQFGQAERSSNRCRQYTHRYRPGRFVGRSQGSPQDGQESPRSASIPGNIEAVGAVLVRVRTYGVRARPAAPRPGRWCRRSRRGARRGATRGGRRPAARPARRRAARPRAGSRGSAGRGASAASRARCTAGRAGRGRSRRRRGTPSRRRRRRATLEACIRRAVTSSARARPGCFSTATISPSSPMSAARCVVLPPGAAQRSSTRSPGRGSSSGATSCDARDCGVNAPAA